MAEGHREAARSVLDGAEHGGAMNGREATLKIMVATRGMASLRSP
jgi:hypothetical protein